MDPAQELSAPRDRRRVGRAPAGAPPARLRRGAPRRRDRPRDRRQPRAAADRDDAASWSRRSTPPIPAPARFAGGHPAKRSFQALRIAVNDELGQLDRALPLAWGLLRKGGVARRHLLPLARGPARQAASSPTARSGCICPPELPVCACGREPEAALLSAPLDRALGRGGRSQPARRLGAPARRPQARRGGTAVTPPAAAAAAAAPRPPRRARRRARAKAHRRRRGASPGPAARRARSARAARRGAGRPAQQAAWRVVAPAARRSRRSRATGCSTA